MPWGSLWGLAYDEDGKKWPETGTFSRRCSIVLRSAGRIVANHSTLVSKLKELS